MLLLGFVPEYKFLEDRKYLIDWFDPETLVGVEYDGIMFRGQGSIGHSSVAGLIRDGEKSNLAQLAGILYLRVNAKSVESGDAMNWVLQALELRGRVIG